MTLNWRKFLLEDLGELMNLSTADVKGHLGNYPFPELDWAPVPTEAVESIQVEILKTICERQLRVSGANDNTVWEKGWGEVADRLETQPFHPDLLRPQYFDFNHLTVLRFMGRYIYARQPDFAFRLDQVIKRILFARHLDDQTQVVDVGCGTGLSEFLLSETCPGISLVAADWAKASERAVSAIAQHINKRIAWSHFNLLTTEGWDNLNVSRSSAVLTVHAMEQVGETFEPFLERLLLAKPAKVMHIEPILEFYRDDTLFDQLACQYHQKRNYLKGYWTRLDGLANQRRIEVEAKYRVPFGNQFQEAYSVIVWKPL